MLKFTRYGMNIKYDRLIIGKAISSQHNNGYTKVIYDKGNTRYTAYITPCKSKLLKLWFKLLLHNHIGFFPRVKVMVAGDGVHNVKLWIIS